MTARRASRRAWSCAGKWPRTGLRWSMEPRTHIRRTAGFRYGSSASPLRQSYAEMKPRCAEFGSTFAWGGSSRRPAHWWATSATTCWKERERSCSSCPGHGSRSRTRWRSRGASRHDFGGRLRGRACTSGALARGSAPAGTPPGADGEGRARVLQRRLVHRRTRRGVRAMRLAAAGTRNRRLRRLGRASTGATEPSA